MADFDGDGTSDVAIIGRDPWFGGEWWISWSGTSPYQWILDEDQTLDGLPIGNFDEEPGADVLLWRNERWFNIVSEGRGIVYPWSRQSMR